MFLTVLPADRSRSPARRAVPARRGRGRRARCSRSRASSGPTRSWPRCSRSTTCSRRCCCSSGCEWCRRPERVRLLWLLALLLGLAFSNQQTIVLLVPALAVLGLRAMADESRSATAADRRRRPGRRAAPVPLPAARRVGEPGDELGRPDHLGRFVNDVTRGDYGTTSLVAGGRSGLGRDEPRSSSGRASSTGSSSPGSCSRSPGSGGRGSTGASRGSRSLVAFLVAGPLFQAYTRTAYPDPLTKGVVARFYILPSIPLAILAGPRRLVGARLGRRPRRSASAPVVVAAAALLALSRRRGRRDHYSAADQSGNHVARELRPRPARRARRRTRCSLMRGDENYTSVSYAQNVEHLRPDVIALDAELLKLPSYVAQMRREHPGLADPVHPLRRHLRPSLNTLVAANLASRPVYSIGVQEEKRFGAPFAQVHAGLATRLEPKGSRPDPYALMRAGRRRVRTAPLPDARLPGDLVGGPDRRRSTARPRSTSPTRSTAATPPNVQLVRAALPHRDPALAGADDGVPEPRSLALPARRRPGRDRRGLVRVPAARPERPAGGADREGGRRAAGRHRSNLIW